MMEKLKPCPFCGGKANFEQTANRAEEHSSVELRFEICCKKCGASPPNTCGNITINLSENGELNVWHDDRNMAIAAWNRRVKDDE